MMKLHPSQYIGLLLLSLLHLDGLAQCTGNVFGPSTAWADITLTYNYSGTCSSCNWSVQGGSIESGQGTSNITVKFNSAGSKQVSHESGCKIVTVTLATNPPAPATPTFHENDVAGCNTNELRKNGNPPTNVTWYWQTTSFGQSTSSNANTPLPVTSGGTYYIRARHNQHGRWSSTTSKSVNSTSINSPPAVPNPSVSVTTNSCGTKTLTVSNNPPSGVLWYWQTTSSGTSTSYPWYNSFYAASSGNYYLRARSQDELDCWGGYNQTHVSVNPYPATPSAPTGAVEGCYSVLLTRPNPPSGVTYYWQTSASGTDTQNSSSTKYAFSTGNYYVRGLSAAGCWGGVSSAKYVTVHERPGVPSISSWNISPNSCGDKTVSVPDGPPNGVSWFFQTSSSGTSTTYGAGNGNTFTVPSTQNVFIRAKNSSEDCWSAGAASTTVVVDPFPAAPPAPWTLQGSTTGCGGLGLERADPPAGVTYYWQREQSGTDTGVWNALKVISETDGTSHPETRTLYLRGLSDAGCWGHTSEITITVLEQPDVSQVTDYYTTYADGIGPCGPQRLYAVGVNPTGVNWYWQTEHDGTVTDGRGAFSGFEITDNQTYYLRAWNQQNNCWSAVGDHYSVSISNIIEYPTPPPVPDAPTEACGPVTITRTGPIPSDQTWYWQGENDDTRDDDPSLNTNDYVGYVPGAPATFYIRALADNTCWSQPTPVTINSVIPTMQITPASPQVCIRGSVELAVTSPEGDHFIWKDLETNNIVKYGSTLITPELTQNTTFEVSAVSDFGCVGTQTVTVVVSPENTHRPNVPTVRKLVNNYELNMGTQEPGQSYFWVSGPGGESADAANPKIVTEGGYYYLRPQNSTGCWGKAVSVFVPKVGFPSQGPINLADVNYVRTHNFKKKSTVESYPADLMSETDPHRLATSTTYIDGLGRPIQEVGKKTAAGQQDLVKPIAYDKKGRPTWDFLPYSGGTDGLVKSLPYTSLASYYNSGTHGVAQSDYPFAFREFEDSPDDIVRETSAPGETWVQWAGSLDSRGVKSDPAYNADEDSVYLWEIENGLPITPVSTYYPKNRLTKAITTDEQGHQVIEFTNIEGQVVLKRVQAHQNGAPEQWADTYYVYDDFGNLRFVLPPKVFEVGVPVNGFVASTNQDIREVLTTSTTLNSYQQKSYFVAEGTTLTLGQGFSFTSTPDTRFKAGPVRTELDHLADLAFQYQYDDRNRMIAKKVPGADWVYLVYDRRDRLVLTQDGNQRSNDQWTFTKYDTLNRPIVTGTYTDAGDLTTIRANVTASNTFAEVENTTAEGYSLNKTFPTTATATDLLTITYYDDYSFVGATGWDAEGNSWPDAGTCNCQTLVNGQVTGAKVKNLVSGKWLNSATYYDSRYRVIASHTENVTDQVDVTTNTYDFTGNLLTSSTAHQGHENHTILREFEYDHADRLTRVYHTLDGGTRTLIAENTYNGIGELVNKKLHSEDQGTTNKQSLDYAYNIRGWLTTVNNPSAYSEEQLFGMQLKYDDASAAQYNGNIGEMVWGSLGDTSPQSYNFSYDPMNRLTGANYSGPLGKDYDVSGITYDLNGNLTALQRKGKTGLGLFGTVDALTYQYLGNQLTNVDDSQATTVGLDPNFKDGREGSGTEYYYDANGNMVSDQNKEVATITYNYLNLPQTVTFNDGKKLEYIYSAVGVKLQQKVYANGGATPTKETDYVGEYIYENDTLKLIQHEEGRLVPGPDPATPDWRYEYHLKDHLGNVRLTFTSRPDSWTYEAGMEPENSVVEEALFANVATTRQLDALQAHTGSNSSRLNAFQGRVVGPAITFPMAKGDTVNLSAWGKYVTPVVNNTTTGALASSVQAAFGLTAVGETAQAFQAFDDLLGSGAIYSFSGDQTIPRAYLNYIYFDEDHQYVTSGFDQVGTEDVYEQLSIQYIPEKPGYIYIYVANETQEDINVFFDDMLIEHKESPVVQSDDYYPFGLAFNNYQRIANQVNRFKYNSKELIADLDLGWYDYGARMYDPTLGRWHVTDPVSDLYANHSPYHYVRNNPIRLFDINGMYDQELVDQWEKEDLEENGFDYGAVKGSSNQNNNENEDNEVESGDIGEGGENSRENQSNGGSQQDPLMDQLNTHLDQSHIGTLLGLEHAPTFHIDRDGQFTSTKNPGHTSFKGALPGASDVYIHPSAFEGQFKLFLVTGHELIHVTHISDGSFKTWLRDYGLSGAINITEFNAYEWQAHQESILGVNYGAASQLTKYRNLLPAGYLNR